MKTNETFMVVNRPSKGARFLRKALDIKPYVSGTRNKSGDFTAINWGIGRENFPGNWKRIINSPDRITRAANKKHFFEDMKNTANGPRTPDWTTSAKQAIVWVKEGYTVLGRSLLNSHSGKGIVFYDAGDLNDFLSCKLFVKYVKNIAEYRVHFAFGNQIDIQRKGLREDADRKALDTRIHSHENGFVYIRNNLGEVPKDVEVQAMKAYRASGLDFGAVDVIWNKHYGQAYVLEINTAPGLEGTTVDNYAEAFRRNL